MALFRSPNVLTPSAQSKDVMRKLIHWCAARGHTVNVQHRQVRYDCQLERSQTSIRICFGGLPLSGVARHQMACQVQSLGVTRVDIARTTEKA